MNRPAALCACAHRTTRLAACAVVLAMSAPAWAAPPSPASTVTSGDALTQSQRIIDIEHDGDGHPHQAAQALEQLLPQTAPFSLERLELLTVRGILLNLASEPEAAEQVAQLLDGWARTPSGDAATAAASLVRARGLAFRGNLQKADALITDALQRLPANPSPRTRLRF